MIIKRKRIKARGQALKRALRHIVDGEDNDAVTLVRGNIADLEDARADAIRFGREYAVRHWSLSPDKLITDQQIAELVDRLCAEFGFDPDRAVMWRHTKSSKAMFPRPYLMREHNFRLQRNARQTGSKPGYHSKV